MVSEEHNRLVGIGHLAYSGVQTVLFLGMALLLMSFLAAAPPGEGGVFVGTFLALFFFILWAVFTLPSLIAGYAILKGKSWARIAGIIASVFAAMNVPHGTVLCVYSLWFFFSEQGNEFYKHAARSEFDPRSAYFPNTPHGQGVPWDATRAPRSEYVPPSQPPDWRS